MERYEITKHSFHRVYLDRRNNSEWAVPNLVIENIKKELLDDDIIQKRFSCLESWCASRFEGKKHKSENDYCFNCRRFNELKKIHLGSHKGKYTKSKIIPPSKDGGF